MSTFFHHVKNSRKYFWAILEKNVSTMINDDPKIIPTVLVHGGSDDNVSDDILWNFKNSVKVAARFGYQELLCTGNVVCAVVEAVSRLEQDPLFNAGYGSALTWNEKIEMDASVMSGKDLSAGCVSLVKNISHPIKLAATVMDKTRHTYLAGDELMDYAWHNDFVKIDEKDLYTNKTLTDLNKLKAKIEAKKTGAPKTLDEPHLTSSGTVGAVAIDQFGNVAAATSTGGIVGKMPGRIGDSAILGAGTYADNSIGCVSSTGHGESIMRLNVASRILARMQYLECSPYDAAKNVLDLLLDRFKKTAGVITLNKKGDIGIYFTAKRMPWAYRRGLELHYGVDQNEDCMEMLKERVTAEIKSNI